MTPPSFTRFIRFYPSLTYILVLHVRACVRGTGTTTDEVSQCALNTIQCHERWGLQFTFLRRSE